MVYKTLQDLPLQSHLKCQLLNKSYSGPSLKPPMLFTLLCFYFFSKYFLLSNIYCIYCLLVVHLHQKVSL